MLFLKKHWELLAWLGIATLFAVSNIQNVTARGFVKSVVAYFLGAALYFIVRDVLLFVIKAVKEERSSDDVDDDENIEYDAACAWRAINLAVAVGEHPEACSVLADLRAAGWHIEKVGSERSGVVNLKLFSPARAAIINYYDRCEDPAFCGEPSKLPWPDNGEKA